MKPLKWIALAAAAAIGLAAALVLWLYLDSRPSATQLAAALPDRSGATLFIDARMIRAAGLMKHFSAPEARQEQDYRDFVAATGFDYTRDLDRVAARFAEGGEVWIAASGRFDHGKIAAYAKSKGGRCVRGICTMPGSSPARQISWLETNRGGLYLAVSPDPLAAGISGSGHPPRKNLPASPAWLHLPGKMLKPAEGLVPGASVLLSALEGADDALLWAGIGAGGLTIEMEAPFRDQPLAEASANKLIEATGMFTRLLAREKPSDGAGLAAILASGKFRAESSSVRGVWNAQSALLDRLLR